MTPIVEKAPISPAMIALAKEFNKAGQIGIELGLTSDELAFYDALVTSEASVIRELLGLAQRKDNLQAMGSFCMCPTPSRTAVLCPKLTVKSLPKAVIRDALPIFWSA